MRQDEQFVIAINRELGSGGRTVGEKLAQRLGVPFYDKMLIQGLKQKYNLSVQEIERLKGQDHHWWADLKRSLKVMPSYAMPNYFSDSMAVPDFLITDDIFKSEVEILKGIAESESCVVAGRSGFYVYRDHPNHLSVFIQASMDFRVARVMRKKNATAEQARKIIDEVDRGRESYVKKYTGMSRYDTRNYDLVLNSDGHTEDEMANIIMAYIKADTPSTIFF